MRLSALFASLLPLVIVSTSVAQEVPLSAKEEAAFQEAVANVDPSLVQIQTTGGIDLIGQVLTSEAPTTGMVMSEDGYIISSAFNFASKPAAILVNLPGVDLPKQAKIVATDYSRMLTLLKIDATGLPVPKFAKEDDLQVGQWAIALGKTFSPDFSNISIGIVSAKDRIYGRAIQTDAKISPHNYGGPIVNIQGEVMGILVPLSQRGGSEVAGVEWYDSGIGFAISMTDIQAKYEELKAGTDLYPGLMGIAFKSRDRLAGEPEVGQVRPASPADKAGIEAGDLIVSIGESPVVRIPEVQQAVGGKYAGEEITLVVKRGEKELTKTFELAKELQAYKRPMLGILPSRTTPEDAPAGVPVRFVLPGSPAEQAGIERRDVIQKINDEAVTNAEELAIVLSRLEPEVELSLEVLRGEDTKTLKVTPVVITGETPEKLPTVSIPPADEDAELPKTGRQTVTVDDWDRSYWMYVPESYNPDHSYGLVVFLHPSNDSLEATVYPQWKSVCDRRGLILLAPKSQGLNPWTPNDAQFVTDAVKKLQGELNIDSTRIVIHGFASSGRFAGYLAAKEQDLFRGCLQIGTSNGALSPDADPTHPLFYYLAVGEKNPQRGQVNQSKEALLKKAHPVEFVTIPEVETEYPPESAFDPIARWIDTLDRL